MKNISRTAFLMYMNILEFGVSIKQALLQLCYEIHRKKKWENENETHMHLTK